MSFEMALEEDQRERWFQFACPSRTVCGIKRKDQRHSVWIAYFCHGLIMILIFRAANEHNPKYPSVCLAVAYPCFCIIIDAAQCVACWHAIFLFIPKHPSRAGIFTAWEMIKHPYCETLLMIAKDTDQHSWRKKS